MTNIPLWLCIPFACLLLCIAIFPLVKPEWWEKNRAYAVILWSLLFIIPFAVKFGAGTALETVLECIIGDYVTFIVLLFGLFCVAGNIKLEGNLAGNPIVNVVLLTIATLCSSWIGTTGASMLFVRPIIQMNSWRKNKTHIMVFFIFLVSNIGGCLTPIGDPPLLMGFSRGVPFFWSLRLLPILVVNMVLLLVMFYYLDRKAYQKDISKGLMPTIVEGDPLIRIKGAHNFIFIIMIVAAVILSGVLPELDMFKNAAGEVIGIHIFGEVTFTVPAIIEIAIILLAAFLVFIVMASQFESLLDPFIVILTIPLSFIGVVAIYAISGNQINVITIIGMLVLVGTIVNNGIVLVDYTNLLRKRGLELKEACIEAAKNRLRPILMSTLTTVISLAPMAFFPGEGSANMQPIALTVFGGMTFGSLMTLFIMPSIYYIFNNRRLKKAAKKAEKDKRRLAIKQELESSENQQ